MPLAVCPQEQQNIRNNINTKCISVKNGLLWVKSIKEYEEEEYKIGLNILKLYIWKTAHIECIKKISYDLTKIPNSNKTPKHLKCFLCKANYIEYAIQKC